MKEDMLSMLPGQKMFTMPEIIAILVKADELGLPLEAGSWVEQLTIAEIERFVNGNYDA